VRVGEECFWKNAAYPEPKDPVIVVFMKPLPAGMRKSAAKQRVCLKARRVT